MRSKLNHTISIFLIALSFAIFIYIVYRAVIVVDRSQISTRSGIYTNRVTTSKEIAQKAKELTRECQTRLCQIQSILDYVTNIPYKINEFKAHSPQKTIKNNYGDCDDKSNLLISMLHSLGIEAYFVLVPEHIFVITHINDQRLKRIRGLWIDGKKFYILESTAKGSMVGFPFRYDIDDIEAIVEPFSNRKIEYKELKYKP